MRHFSLEALQIKGYNAVGRCIKFNRLLIRRLQVRVLPGVVGESLVIQAFAAFVVFNFSHCSCWKTVKLTVFHEGGTHNAKIKEPKSQTG